MNRHTRGFTLVEMLVVVAIAAFAFVAMGATWVAEKRAAGVHEETAQVAGLDNLGLGTAQRQARITSCLSNVKQMGLAFRMYEASMQKMPAEDWLKELKTDEYAAAFEKNWNVGNSENVAQEVFDRDSVQFSGNKEWMLRAIASALEVAGINDVKLLHCPVVAEMPLLNAPALISKKDGTAAIGNKGIHYLLQLRRGEKRAAQSDLLRR